MTEENKQQGKHKYFTNDERARWATFGSWLKAERRAKHLTRARVADELGIHQVQLARIEGGTSRTRRDIVSALARIIGFDESEALDRAGFSPDGDPSPGTSRLYTKLRALPPERQEDVEAMIDVFLLMSKTMRRPQIIQPSESGWLSGVHVQVA